MDRSYPVGKFKFNAFATMDDVPGWIDVIRTLPGKLEKEVTRLSEEVLDTPYREGGWTVRQVVHHIADSHMNAMIRVKLALTEDNPTIKPYDQDGWTRLGDYEAVSVQDALQLIRILHAKWVAVLEKLEAEDFKKTFFHPESKIEYTVFKATEMYAWHCNHHLAHIQLVTQSN